MKKKYSSISVIILNYNGEKFLENCLKSVLDTDYPNFEVIVVDNNSKDRSIEIINGVKPFFEAKNIPFVIVKNSKNLGFAEGNNVGARFAKGDYIYLLNNDTLVDKHWLNELVKILDNDTEVGAAQSKILSMQNSNHLSTQIDCAGGFINPYGFAIERGFMDEDRGQYNKIEDIFYAKGAAAVFRKDLFHYLGGLDPNYFFYYEEVDFSWKIMLVGYRVVFVPNSVIYHMGGASAKKVPSLSKFHHDKNRICTLIKNYNCYNLIKYLGFLIFLEFLHMFYYIFIKKLEHSERLKLAKAIFKAMIWNLLNLKSTLFKRREVQHNFRRVPDKNIFKVIIKTRPLYPFQKYKL
ncbi:MAG: glycosyltransferase family 2 protein [Candidatus Freyarchaeum deiterrae]